MKKLKAHRSFEGETAFWSHSSTETQTEMKFASFVPKGEVKACIIWLSGLTCTEENFISKAGAQRFLAEQQLMLVAPDTSPRGLQLAGEHESWDFGSGAGFYVDATQQGYASHYRMYSYIVSEVYALITSTFAIKNISIMGHSMGGHGALVIGLRNPSLFKCISALAPISHPTLAPWGIKAFTGYLGSDRQQWQAYDSCELLKTQHRHPAPILIHQGDADEFLANQLYTEHWIQAAKAVDQKHLVKFCAGYDHSFYFIASFIEEHILHHAKYLKEPG